MPDPIDADDLRAALDRIIDDLVATGAMDRERATHLVWEEAQVRRDHLDEPLAWTAFSVAESMQEWVMEHDRRIPWPACPHHRDHPLWLQDDDTPTWTCPATDEPIAPLGGLTTG